MQPDRQNIQNIRSAHCKEKERGRTPVSTISICSPQGTSSHIPALELSLLRYEDVDGPSVKAAHDIELMAACVREEEVWVDHEPILVNRTKGMRQRRKT